MLGRLTSVYSLYVIDILVQSSGSCRGSPQSNRNKLRKLALLRGECLNIVNLSQNSFSYQAPLRSGLLFVKVSPRRQ